MSRKTRRNHPPSPTAAPDDAASGASSPLGRRGLLLLGLGAALLLVLLAGVLLLRGESPGQATDGARQAALLSENAPSLGDPSARVHIVEFLDPACETCALFYPLGKRMLDAEPGRIRLSIRHVAFHEGSDYVVRLLEASRRQDLYWPTLEALLASQATWAPHHTVRPELAREAIGGVGLDLARLEADMNDPEVLRRVERDLADAKTLAVTKTPAYFVNGRPLPSFGAQQLFDLVSEELRRAYASP